MKDFEREVGQNQVGGVIVHETMEALRLALQFRLWGGEQSRFTGWWEETEPDALFLTTTRVTAWDSPSKMTVYWNGASKEHVLVTKFLTPATDEEVAELVGRWLRAARYQEPGPGPGDGTWNKGFRISFSMGPIGPAFIIRPEWILYAK